MKLIATEEHYMSKAVNEQYMKVMTKLVSPAIRARLEGLQHFLESNREISDLGELRLAAMDKQGVDIQVISYGNNSPMVCRPKVLFCFADRRMMNSQPQFRNIQHGLPDLQCYR